MIHHTMNRGRINNTVLNGHNTEPLKWKRGWYFHVRIGTRRENNAFNATIVENVA